MRNIIVLLCLIFILFYSNLSCSKKNEESTKNVVDKIEDVKPINNQDQTQIPPDKLLSPLDSIKELDKKIEKYKTNSNLTEEEQKANEELKKEIIRGTFDLYELCRLALDVHWDNLKEEDHRYFTDLMTRLLEKKAIFSKEQVKDQSKPYKIDYKEQIFTKADQSQAEVRTTLYIPSEKIDLQISYHLNKTPYGWKIFDVIVDEASLVENYKFQFNTIITKNGYQDLVDRMEMKLKKME